MAVLATAPTDSAVSVKPAKPSVSWTTERGDERGCWRTRRTWSSAEEERSEGRNDGKLVEIGLEGGRR